MHPSNKFLLTRSFIFATIFFIALGTAPNTFVSSSHRQVAETRKVAPQGAALPGRYTNTVYLGNTLAVGGSANCDALLPSGGDDSIAINACLNTVGHVTLTANTFRIYQPIQAISLPNGVAIIGAGKNTKLDVQFTCGDPRFLDGGTYKIPIEIRRSPNSVLSNFNLHLDQLRKSCGHGGNSAISVNRSEGTRVTGVRVIGSRYGDPGYTTGWVHGGGISVVNSANSVITDNVVKDVGFASGGVSVGFDGIGIRNSANSLVQNNTVTRVGFGIEIVNGSPSQGFTGDSSGTVVTGNTITGAALIGCPECSHGRAIKFQACGVGDELPIKNVTLTYNNATSFGGQSGGNNAGQGGSGLHLTCGVQYSRIENNTFIGAPTAEMGLLVDSAFPAGTPPNPTHHNLINFNTFYSGRGEVGCNGNCADVEFNNLGPDQIGIDRGSRGNNTLKPVSSGHAIRVRFTHGCSQYSHAWFLYPSGQNFVYQGQSILVAGAGILPPSFFSVIRFSFRNSSGVEVASYETQRSQSNCVVNQELASINPSLFAPGLYSVFANYYDGNTDVLYIPNDLIGTLDVRAFQSNQPPVAGPGGPYNGTVNSSVQFNGTGSFDPDGFITNYQWNFGDGTTGSGSMPTHAYSAANTYTVTLTVTDNAGAQRSASTTSNISASQSQTPFNGPHNIPGILQAEDFDNGGEGVAFHDTTPGNDFGQYRSTAVDIANSTGLPGDYDVANAWASEWLEYTVNVTTAGNYDIQAFVASDGPGGTFHYEVDGVVKGTVSVPNTGGWATFLPVTLPNVSFTAGLHILRVALDTNGSQPFPAIANFNYFNFVASGGGGGATGPVGYWKFDEGSGTFAGDSSGNGNHGTLTNGPLWTTGKVNSALSFDGLNDYVQVGARPSLVMSNAMTMSAWVFPTGSGGIIVNKEGEYEVAVSGTVQWAVANSFPGWAWVDTGFAPPLNQWSHVAVVYDNGIVRTYANGTLFHTFNGSGSINDVDPAQNDFRIGGRQCCVQHFGGRIDEVLMHNRALSASEIQALANTAPAPVGYWKFDEGSGTIAGDSSGNNLTGTLQLGPTWIGGRVNGALNFDGFNDYIQVGSQPALKMSNTLTLSAWIRPTSSTSTRTIVNREGEYNIGMLSGVLSWAFSNANPGWNWVSTGYTPPLSQWTHIAVVYDLGIIKTYANGILVHTYNGSGSIIDASTPENDFRIGSRQCGFCSEYFQGGIDEVRMYNTALSASDIQTLANP